jgi:hypothetical protein
MKPLSKRCWEMLCNISLVDDQQAGIGAIEFLQTSREGRGGFIPISAVKPWSASTGSQDAGDLLLSHVKVAPEYEAIAQALLGHVCIVPSLAGRARSVQPQRTHSNAGDSRRANRLPSGSLDRRQPGQNGRYPGQKDGIERAGRALCPIGSRCIRSACTAADHGSGRTATGNRPAASHRPEKPDVPKRPLRPKKRFSAWAKNSKPPNATWKSRNWNKNS